MEDGHMAQNVCILTERRIREKVWKNGGRKGRRSSRGKGEVFLQDHKVHPSALSHFSIRRMSRSHPFIGQRPERSLRFLASYARILHIVTLLFLACSASFRSLIKVADTPLTMRTI